MPVGRIRALPIAAALVWAGAVQAAFVVDELYSNADGSVQFVVLREADNSNGLDHFQGLTLSARNTVGRSNVFTFPSDLPGSGTAGRRVLIASRGYAALGLIAADFTIPDRFLPSDGGAVNFASAAPLAYPQLPGDGVNAFYATQSTAANAAINFAGQTVSLPAGPVTAFEFYNATLDHFFVSPLAPDIMALDPGNLEKFSGWTRTGRGFAVYPTQASAGADASPVCRFLIPPQHGDSHFISASVAECADILARIPVDPNYSGYVYESPSVFYATLPNTTTGACPASMIPVYRLWNQRTDSNHRITPDAGIKDSMVAKGYLPEGYGPGAAAMCSPAAVLVDALTRASGFSTFAPGCDGVPANGTVYASAEVEPYVAINPANPDNVIGVWQQDRWSNGGSRGLGGAFSFDGGGTWTRTSVPFSRCSGGNAANGGNYERATDPWVTFTPDGVAYQIAVAYNNQANGNSAVLVSRSADGGRTWSNPVSVRQDGGQNFNDKESISADPTDARYVYAAWDRLAGSGGPTWFARTRDAGATWDAARSIYDPGPNRQTLNNQIVVLPDGTLVLFFTELATTGNPDAQLRIARSGDKGATWSAPLTVASVQSVGTANPDGTSVRDGSLIGAIAAGRNGTLAVAWQDSRFAAGAHDDIAFARSTDGGLTWSPPARINAFPDVGAFLPSVAIRDDGTIGVAYYDRSASPPSLNLWLVNYRLATSADGASWRTELVAGAFDFENAPLAGGEYFLGDYMALATTGTTFLPFFAIVPILSGFTGSYAGPSDILAALRRVPTAAALIKESGAEKAAAIAQPMPPEAAERVAQNARRVLARRRPARTFDGDPREP